MLKFLNPHDQVILSEMIVHGEQTFGPVRFWTEEKMLGPLIRRAMGRANVEVTVCCRKPNDQGLPKEIDFVWHLLPHYERDTDQAMYARSFNDQIKYDEEDKAVEKIRYLNGGWINHGTDDQPNWGSHT